MYEILRRRIKQGGISSTLVFINMTYFKYTIIHVI